MMFPGDFPCVHHFGYMNVELCFQYLGSSSSEYVDLSAMALDLQKLYRQVICPGSNKTLELVPQS